MRRKDREITNKEEIVEIIEKCEVCRLAFAKDNMPYIVPLNYGYEYKKEKLIFYFHGAKEGKKLDIIKANPNVCFELDCAHKLSEGQEADRFSMEYESVIGNGKIYVITDKEEKRQGLKMLMRQYVKNRDFNFSDAVLENTAVLRLDVSDFTGKRNMKRGGI